MKCDITSSTASPIWLSWYKLDEGHVRQFIIQSPVFQAMRFVSRNMKTESNFTHSYLFTRFCARHRETVLMSKYNDVVCAGRLLHPVVMCFCCVEDWRMGWMDRLWQMKLMFFCFFLPLEIVRKMLLVFLFICRYPTVMSPWWEMFSNRKNYL